MRDSEFNNFSEYNNIKEQNKSMWEAYAPFEHKTVKEECKIEEENDEKSAKATAPVKQKLSFKDRIIESTSPLRTIVSAATCTVAAVVTTTTFLTNTPDVTDMDLYCGNDYVSYSISVDDLDIDRSYKIEVSKPGFDYTDTIDITEINEFNRLTGVINGLKPNYRYDFKLLRDNGEVGGYSAYYTKSFYTTKAPDPTATFEYETDGDTVTVTSYLSDYYDLLSDSYLCVSVDGVTEKYGFTDKFCKITVKSENRTPVLFEVYSVLYDENKVISSGTYTLTNIKGKCENNIIRIFGTADDIYKYIREGVVYLTLYNANGEIVKEEESNIDLTKEIDCSFDLTNDSAFYSFKVVGSTGIEICSTDITKTGNITTLEFGTQRLTEDSLRLTAMGFNGESAGYITDANGAKIPISFDGNEVVIPLFDDNNYRIKYNGYKLVIDDKEYNLNVNTKEIYVDSVELIQIDKNMNIGYKGLLSLTDNNYIVNADIKANGVAICSFGSISEDEYKQISGDTIIPDSVDVEFYLTDESGLTVSDRYTINGVSVASIGLSARVDNDLLTVNTRATSNNFIIKYNTFDSNGFVAENGLDILYNDNNEGTATATVEADIKKMYFDVYYKDNLLYSYPEINLLNGNLLSQNLTGNSIELDTDIEAIEGGYILDAGGKKIDLITDGKKLVVPLYSGEDIINYTDYTLYISNAQASNTLSFNPEGMMFIRNFSYENSYSANKYISFESNIISTKVYTLEIELYENEDLIESCSVNKEDILLKNGYSCMNVTDTSDTVVRIYFKDDSGNVIGQEFSSTITKEAKGDSNFQMNMKNPGDILVTYNDDGTMNLYIGVDYQTSDADLKLAIELNSFTSGEIYTYEFAPNTKVAVIENIKNDAYGICYKVHKQYDNMNRIYENTMPSGGINEESDVYLIGSIIEENGKNYLMIDATDIAVCYSNNSEEPNKSFDASKCFAQGYSNIVYDEQTHTFKVELNESETDIGFTVYYGSATVNNLIDSIIALDDSIQIKGGYGQYRKATIGF